MAFCFSITDLPYLVSSIFLTPTAFASSHASSTSLISASGSRVLPLSPNCLLDSRIFVISSDFSFSSAFKLSTTSSTLSYCSLTRFSSSETNSSAPDVPASTIALTSAFFDSSSASCAACSSAAFSASAASAAFCSACCIAIFAAVSLATFFANSSRLKSSVFSDISFSFLEDRLSSVS